MYSTTLSKGGVEGEVGRFRRSHLVPVPEVASLAELNDLIAAACIDDLIARSAAGRSRSGRRSAGRSSCSGRCPPSRLTPPSTRARRVDGKALATVRQNQYSLPVRLAGLRVAARIGAREVVFSHDGKVVARHERLQERFGVSAQLDHYLELLKVKPGALSRSLALRQERERGRGLIASISCGRRSPSESAPRRPPGRWSTCCCSAVSSGPSGLSSRPGARWPPARYDGRAVAVLARRADRPAATPLTGLDQRLAQADRPEPTITDYDQLLGDEAGR